MTATITHSISDDPKKKETIFPAQDETAVVILNLNTLTQLRICEIHAYKVNNRIFFKLKYFDTTSHLRVTGLQSKQ